MKSKALVAIPLSGHRKMLNKPILMDSTAIAAPRFQIPMKVKEVLFFSKTVLKGGGDKGDTILKL